MDLNTKINLKSEIENKSAKIIIIENNSNKNGQNNSDNQGFNVQINYQMITENDNTGAVETELIEDDSVEDIEIIEVCILILNIYKLY